MSKYCSNCGREIVDTAVNCVFCGAAAGGSSEKYCANCGSAAAADAKHCSQCGAPFAPGSGPAADQRIVYSTQPAPAEQQPERKSVARRWWFWFLMGLATVFSLAVLSSLGESSEKPDPVPPSSSESSYGSEESSTEPESSSEAPDFLIYSIGDAVTVGNMEYIVIKVTDEKKLGSKYLNETTDYNFAVVQVEARNTGNEEENILSSMIRYYRGEAEYEPNTAALYMDDGFCIAESVGAGLSKTFSVVFEIPSEYLPTDCVMFRESGYSVTGKKVYLKYPER